MLGYDFDWNYLWSTLPELLAAFGRTLLVSAFGVVGSLAIGGLGAPAKNYGPAVVRRIVGAYVEVVRNTPHLVLLVFLYFALPDVGVRLPTLVVAVLALSLVEGAYNVEALRAAMDAVPFPYVRAGRALGLSGPQVFRLVVLPNSVRIALPALANNSISVVKTSTLLIAIGYPDLMATSISEVSLSFRVFEVFSVMAALYLIGIWSLSSFARYLERHLAIQGL